jgi:hypothetical protein
VERNASPTNISLILVPSPMNLVEICESQQFYTTSGLLTSKLIEEIIFSTRRRRVVDGSDLETTIGVDQRLDER